MRPGFGLAVRAVRVFGAVRAVRAAVSELTAGG